MTDLTRDELAQDGLAPRESLRMTADLSHRAKVVREQITEIESHAADVESSSLRETAALRIAELRSVLYGIVAAATHGQHTPGDVAYWAQSVQARGGKFPTFDARAIRALLTVAKVPNAAIREGVLRHLEDGTSSYADIASTTRERLQEAERRCDEDYGSTAWACDTEESTTNAILGLRRRLGIKSVTERGIVRCAFLIQYEEAVAVSQAIGMNPLQAGV